ncbi:MAG: FG-GAP repeat protein [Spirochaetales bacterium]|nr:FG-GAP repeat protein [Spirochaetales bacterium]
MERIIIQRRTVAGASLAVLVCLLLGILLCCDDIPMRLIIDDLGTRDPEWVFMYKIEAPEGSSNVDFGTAVSVSGDYIIVGDENCHDYEGRAYIYKRNGDTWELDATIIPSGTAPYYFGFSVDIWGTQAVSGAYMESVGADLRGAVYIYELESGIWGEEYYHISPNNDDWLGYSVGIAEDIAVVGVPNYDASNVNQGYVKIFKKNMSSWDIATNIVASDPHINDNFGMAVDIYGNYIIVGAPNFDDGKVDTGKIYIFKFDGLTNWVEQSLPSFTESLVTQNYFGQSVSIFDPFAFAGAPNNNLFTAVYSRDGDDWSKNDLPAGGEGFGGAVGVADNFAIIGAPEESDNRGEIYIYKRSGSTWTRFGNPFKAGDRVINDYFGCSVAISSDYCVVGAEGHGTDDEGAVYVYKYVTYETPK